MNTFDYLFENTSTLEKLFLVGREEITFSELHISCMSLANWLEKKVGQKKHIILISENNLFFIKSYLAILKSGNIVTPLDPNIEKGNFNYINKLIKPHMIFITQEVARKLVLKSEILIFPETLTDDPVNAHQLTGQDFDRETCAEIIFTSGSTGKPKGVMISHKNIIANTRSIIEYLKLNQDDRILVVLPFYYCYGLSLLHTYLRAGGSIVLNNSFIFLESVIRNLKEYKCTRFAGVPSHFQILLRKSDSFKRTEFPDLKYVTQAGGKLPTIFIDEFRESHPDIKFIVMYGQTEATARLSYLPTEFYEKKRGSIGKGIPGVELKVINEKDEEIKPGETGEVIARGDNIMMGYFADEAGTKNAIRKGWLHTGDLGTIDEDGYIYLTARKNEIIKVGGNRISPKEIESVILEIPEVVDCTVQGVDDELLGEAIKATIVINFGKEEDKSKILEKIKHHCSQNLTLYKIPGIFMLTESLIISTSGKKTIRKL